MSDTGFRPAHGEADWYDERLPRAIRSHRFNPIRTLATITLVVVLASLLGISSAYLIIEREQPLNAVTLGPWHAYPKAGTSEADPYSVAIYTRGAVIPLASGEGLALVAREDSNGHQLDPTCVYRIAGQTPSARLWTLTAVDGHGRLVKTMSGRVNLASDTLLRNPDGTFEITAATWPHSGNWLPLAVGARAADGLRFVLRVYDAPVTTGAALDGVTMPTIDRMGCP
ncbi:hypothetical protein SIAM614_16922 [Stappia aggregata IAM 12614]|uniref:DUF1214 domain-containing protein n=1 Tax=Roseibium aggregatum (strain ATCC 25650 / DSM 13394 / JCM 20685 / NBRC 16684 / NCIMB 2208 / IAM 12614 / B1) TaxID=384765 RepID=A0P2Z0_ROSAI|nr:DUF1214 domain-containing protein [Roseibium aggregatum]EAV40599.1 hypothetical protein SIAM614_16922 [Stappia aggregata IAM 12614] [Roseibium aggregatum IAM 12614]